MSALVAAAGFLISHRLILRFCTRSGLVQAPELAPMRSRQAATYFVFLLFTLGASGFRLPGGVLAISLLALFAFLNFILIFVGVPSNRRGVSTSPFTLAVLFFVSGVAALVYQVTWQRALHAYFGVNIESATIIVTIFMFGLGVGGIVGGLVSRSQDARMLIKAFLACELMVGLFGVASLPLIRQVGRLTVTSALPATAFIIFGLLSIPTLLMGATLPLLVSYADRKFSHVGRSVGLLYFVNTLGSALACYLTADVLFVVAGQQTATLVAACFNFAVSFAVYGLLRADPVVAPAQHSEGEPLAMTEPESAR
jgi:hypothetical protein